MPEKEIVKEELYNSKISIPPDDGFSLRTE